MNKYSKIIIYSILSLTLASLINNSWAAEQPVGVQVVAKINTQIGAPMSGTISNFPLVDGARFNQGDVIVRFQCAQQEAALAHANAQQQKAQGILLTQQRLKSLGTYSQVEYKTAASDLQAAIAEVAMANANQANCTVRAPFSGRVSNMAVHEHQYVQAGTPMLDILNDHELELEAIVPSIWLRWLKMNDKFEVTVNETGQAYQATLSRMSGRVDPVSRTIKIYGTVDSNADNLLPGMSGVAKFNVPASLPANAQPASNQTDKK